MGRRLQPGGSLWRLGRAQAWEGGGGDRGGLCGRAAGDRRADWMMRGAAAWMLR